MALAGSRPVYVCLQTIYGLDLGAFLATPPANALSLPGRGLALRPGGVYTPIDLIFAHFSALQDMCICMLSVNDPSLKYGQFLPPREHESEYEGVLSRRVHASTCVQPGPLPKYRLSCVSARDTVCPSGYDVLMTHDFMGSQILTHKILWGPKIPKPATVRNTTFFVNYTIKSIFSGVSPPPTLQIRNFPAPRSTMQA